MEKTTSTLPPTSEVLTCALAVARDVQGSMTAKSIAAAKLAGHLIEGENGQALTDADLSKLTYSIGYGAYYVPDGIKVPLIRKAPFPSSSKHPTRVRANQNSNNKLK